MSSESFSAMHDRFCRGEQEKKDRNNKTDRGEYQPLTGQTISGHKITSFVFHSLNQATEEYVQNFMCFNK